ncbi:G2/M phase-specific E3 ubiquitin-protein ligase-like [Melanotaenia boesemani]|uniref:G2/M phase-specific E3 ubiquitin-protein ligase-like n=1 Tax=Melanotaenia boesemani TaxID=1250792 RepID=UPI001C04BC98|nr:G2/M phase-specific E3 ubiquitin-protein ligase-like [Melanotaenia boesemani]
MRDHMGSCPSLPSVAASPCVDMQRRGELNTPSRSEEPSCSFSEVRTEETPFTSREEGNGTVFHSDWRSEVDPDKAAQLYKSKLLSEHDKKKPLLLRMDLQDSFEDQEGSLISFYKASKIEWASPLSCKLEGDVAVGEGVNRFFLSKAMSLLQFGLHMNFGGTKITRLFEGEADHLTPSTAQFLLDSDMFLVAGRMIGHSFLHGGPSFAGLSPAIVHVLCGGSPETSTIHTEDCPDIDIRSIIQSLEGTAELTPEEKKAVHDLALSWDLPDVTEGNRKWLHERLLFHAVISRTGRQVKQLRKGLKDTMIWELLKERADIVPKIFPRNSEAALNSHSVIERILWPVMEDDEDEEECSLDDKCRVAGYLRNFIENATCTQLKALLKFWTGWELLPSELTLEIVNSDLPKSSTCFETLRLPAHYHDYQVFVTDLQACLNTTDTGFGLV